MRNYEINFTITSPYSKTSDVVTVEFSGKNMYAAQEHAQGLLLFGSAELDYLISELDEEYLEFELELDRIEEV